MTSGVTKTQMWSGPAAFFAIVALLTLARAVEAPFPFRGGDEQGHLSYVFDLVRTGQWWPDLAAMPLYDLAGAPREGLNFINHPPTFYWIAAPVQQRLAALGLGPEWLRAFTLIWSFAAFATLALLMARARHGFAISTAIAAAMAFLLVPTFAAFFNNDQFALFGGALACLGVLRRVEDRGDTAALALALAGVALCSVKLTALLMVGAFAAIAFLGRDLRRPDVPALALLVALGLLVSAPYGLYMLDYGSPAPTTLGQIEMLRAYVIELGWDRVPKLEPLEYLAQVPVMFSFQMGSSSIVFFAFLALCAAPLVAFARPRDEKEAAVATVARAGLIATYAVLVLHVGFAHRRYAELGWLGDLYPRYYFPLLGAYALGWGLFLKRASASELWRRVISAIRPQFSAHRPD